MQTILQLASKTAPNYHFHFSQIMLNNFCFEITLMQASNLFQKNFTNQRNLKEKILKNVEVKDYC